MALGEAMAVTPGDPAHGLGYGFAPRAQLFGFTAAVIHYTCFPRAVASVASRLLRIPRVGYYDDCGLVVPRALVRLALSRFAK